MPVPSVSTNFPDILDSRFAKFYSDRYKQLPDRLAEFFSFPEMGPTKDTYRMTQMGTFGDIPEFTGTVTYDDVNEGFDSTVTPKEYASGFQIERKLFDDGLYGIMDAMPKGLATAYQRTRQKHGAQVFNNAFSVDSTWNNNSENVAMCSNSHTTRAAGVSTAVGFDNLTTGALNAVNLATIRISMRNFRDDRANRIDIEPDMVLIPTDLFQVAYEIDESQGQPDTANNDANWAKGRFRFVEWNWLSDINNFFVMDSTLMKDALVWIDRVADEFAMVEDFETLVGKWRIYCRYGNGWNDWRFINGAQVS